MFLKSEIIRSPHAFSTRRGGVSGLSHTSSLNLAFDRGDDDGTVLENLNIFSRAAGIDARSVISLPQIHSSIVHKVTREDAGLGYFRRELEGERIREGDGYVTNGQGVTLGVKSADCVPILFEAEDGNGRIIAVGAVHAGWRGTVGGIAAVCVRMLCEEYGAEPKNIRAAVGPCIHKCCYEVGDEVAEAVVSLGDKYSSFITPKGNGKYTCDLPAINREIMLDAGFLPENIDLIDKCTYDNPELFYSHRYSNGKRGTMLSIIAMG